MSKQILIIGAGGHGREALDIVDAINHSQKHAIWEFLGFVDDGTPNLDLLQRRGVRHLGGFDRVFDLDAHWVVAIGDGKIRRFLDERVPTSKCQAAILLHPAATVGSDVHIGPGAIVAAGARLTTNIMAGRHLHVNTNATVGHDSRLGNYVTISPGANLSGGVTLGDEAFIGTNAAINQGRTVGPRAVVASGAVVVRDVPPDTVVMGVPAHSRSQ